MEKERKAVQTTWVTVASSLDQLIGKNTTFNNKSMPFLKPFKKK
jgi:hypothetical protein